MNIPLFRPSITEAEVEAAAQALRSGWLGTGPQVGYFEAEFAAYIGVRPDQCIATNSCTSALRIAVGLASPRAVSALTFVADPEAIEAVRATRPAALDVDPVTLCSRPSSRAIHVHYAGYPMDATAAAIEDCAHAMGARWQGRHVGTMARFGCFSFHAVKNLTTGDGGMLVCNREEDAPVARAMAWHGIDRDTWDRMDRQAYSWEYRVSIVGCKGRMNDIAAAIGRCQLRRLDAMRVARERIAEQYHSELRGVDLPAWSDGHAWHLYVIHHDRRDALAERMKARGIACGVHYRPWTEYRPYQQETPPVVAREWKRLLSLPMYPDMTEAEQDSVIAAVNEWATAGG